MPTYAYETILPNGKGGERFEVVQPMGEAALQHHPETGEPVRRLFVPPQISTGRFTERNAEKVAHDDKKLEKLGFTKYVRGGSGYEKVVGKGPDIIKKDS